MRSTRVRLAVTVLPTKKSTTLLLTVGLFFTESVYYWAYIPLIMREPEKMFFLPVDVVDFLLLLAIG